GWAYLATVIDLGSRRVVGWALADHMRTELVSSALEAAFGSRRPEPGLIFHSDRGCQYTSRDFRELAEAHGVTLSLGRKGDCFDKGFVSHCTSWCWLGGNSSAEVASLSFDRSGLAGYGRVEEPGVAVIGLVTGEQAGTVPGLDGGWMHAEDLGDLGNGELAGSMQAVAPAGQRVIAA